MAFYTDNIFKDILSNFSPTLIDFHAFPPFSILLY
jgi:hypothetical protein